MIAKCAIGVSVVACLLIIATLLNIPPFASWSVPTMVFAFTALAIQMALIGYLGANISSQRRLQSEHENATAALEESQARNTAILSALPDLMFVMDETGNYLDWYARETQDLYVPPEQFLGKNMRDIFPPELAEKFARKLHQAASTNEPATVEYSLNIDSKLMFFETRIVKCGDGKLLSIARNMT